MVPFLWIFIAWIILVGLFCVTSLVTLATALRYGLSCTWTYLIAGIFIAVSVGAILLMLGYAATLDLSQSLDVFSLL